MDGADAATIAKMVTDLLNQLRRGQGYNGASVSPEVSVVYQRESCNWKSESCVHSFVESRAAGCNA